MAEQPLKICFLNSDPHWGGGVTFYKTHALGVQKMGHDVIGVCAHDSPLSEFYSDHSIPQWKMNIGRLAFVNPLKIMRLARFFKREKVSAVIMTTSEDLKLGAIAAKIAGVPKIIYRRGLAVPIKNRLTNRFIFKKIVTHLIANSEETKRTVLENLSEVIQPDDVHVIYNGLDSKILAQPAEPIWKDTESKAGHIVIGNAARMSPEKGQLMLIPVAKELKARGHQFTILIAGNGRLEDELKAEIGSNGLSDEIKLIGYVDNIQQFMSAIDIFVLTSQWEGFGYVLVEAMLQKKPVIGFDTSSMPEVILHNKNGLLVANKDIMGMADSIEVLINSPEKRARFGSNGYDFAIQNFELEGQIKKFINFILA